MPKGRDWFKLMPEPIKFLDYQAKNQFISNVSVIENLDLPRFDILISPESKIKFSYRFEGKALNEGVKKWKKTFNSLFDTKYLMTYLDFYPCILRFVVNDMPEFMKVEAIYYVDESNEKVKQIPARKIEEFCTKINVDYLPLVYFGDPNFDKIAILAKTPIMGVARKGIFVIHEQEPYSYLTIDLNENIMNLSNIAPSLNMNGALNLAHEFATLIVNEQTVSVSVKEERDFMPFIEEILKKSQEENLFQEYASRCKLETGLDEKSSTVILEDAVADKVTELFNKVNNIIRVK